MPLDTVLLVDTSGSMAGRGIRELKRACTTFMDGVEETARQTGLKENVGIVEFNQTAKVLQSLTNNYAQCRRAIDTLKAGGQTAMFDGLTTALEEVVKNGGVLRVAGIPMTPRIILMTDGRPTDPKVGEDEAREKVLKAAILFGPGWRVAGLPYPVPIACVGCGDCDPSLLDAIADITKGMFVIVENIAELSTFFRRQVLLIRFAAKFASDMQRLRSQLALAAFLRDLGEAVEEAEVAGMQRLLLAMLHMADDDDDDDSGEGPSGRPTSTEGASGPTPRAITAGPSSSSSSSTSPPGATSSQSRFPPGASGGSAVVRPPPSQGSTRILLEQRRVLVASARPPGPPPPPGLYRPPGPRGPNREGQNDEECVIQ